MLKKLSKIALVAIACLALAGTAVADHSWATYHWASTAMPNGGFPLPVIDSMTAEWDTAFNGSISRWNQSSVIEQVVVSVEEDSRARKRCRAVSGHMRVCNAAYGQNGWLGLASINLDSNGHIVKGTAKMNDSYDWYFADNPGEDNHVTCQEIGHVYGLGHTSEDGSSQGTCMDYSTSQNSQWPNAHDYAQLEAIYNHDDGYNSYATDGDGGGTCNAPPGKGCNKASAMIGVDVPRDALLMSFDAGNEARLGYARFVRPDGQGGLWIYHMTLLPEELDHEDHQH